MATRYWHWLLTKKQNEPVPTEYKVRGTAINNSQFSPDYAGYERVPLMDNNYYSYYLNGDIDPEITPLDDKVYYYYDYQDYTQKYFYIENNEVVDYTPPKPNGSITFNVKFKTNGVVDSESTQIDCDIDANGNWEFTYPTNKVIYSIDGFHNENDTYYDEIYGEFSDYATHILTSVDFSKCDRLNNLVSMTNAFSGCVYLRNIVFSNKQSFTNLEYATDAFFDCNLVNSAVVKILSAPNLTDDYMGLGLYSFYDNNIHYAIKQDSQNAYYLSIDDYYNSDNTVVTIPSQITIGNNTLTVKNIIINNNTGRDAFYQANITRITIPNTIQRIGWGSFISCDDLTTVVINSNSVLWDIGICAFYGCNNLQQITLPNTVTTIGSYAFGYCESLTQMTIPNSVTMLGYSQQYGNDSFWEDYGYGSETTGVWRNYYLHGGGDSPYGKYGEEETSVFAYCYDLASVVLSNTITQIVSECFYDCTSLTSITIPNSVTEIHSHAFENCESLSSVQLSNNLVTIGYHAFNNNNLSSISFPSTIRQIDTGNFIGVQNVSFPNINVLYTLTCLAYDRATNYGVVARYLKANNINQITIPNTVTEIGGGVFACCDNLTSVTIPNTITKINDAAFLCCTGLTQITIPNSVTRIGESTFEQCTGLTQIVIPNSVITIGESAFKQCTGLTQQIVMPNSLTEIDRYCFNGCSGLTDIYIPISVTTIGCEAFNNNNITFHCEAQSKPADWYVMYHYSDGEIHYWNTNMGTVNYGETW